jgi:hypothetical protein
LQMRVLVEESEFCYPRAQQQLLFNMNPFNFWGTSQVVTYVTFSRSAVSLATYYALSSIF